MEDRQGFGDMCVRCGNCCFYTTPLVSEEDLKRWKGEKRKDILKQLEKYRLWHTIRREDGHCVFYDEKKLCRIHETKPESCRNFPHSKEAGVKIGCRIFVKD